MKGRFLPFREGVRDHRIVYINIDEQSWLEGDTFKIKPPHIRKLKCGDVRIVRKYLQELRKQLESKSIPQRINSLYNEFHSPLTPFQIEEYEHIDKFMTKCCLSAEKNAAK